MPYLLETTLETGSAGGSGGKEWDVRPVKPRALLKAEESNGVAGEIESMEAKLAELGPNGVVSESIVDDGWEMVCRPKVGERTFGGGFVAVFRRMRSY
jgi:tRNA (adenine57-N1/adenine58-N1)-methyltransferase